MYDDNVIASVSLRLQQEGLCFEQYMAIILSC